MTDYPPLGEYVPHVSISEASQWVLLTYGEGLTREEKDAFFEATGNDMTAAEEGEDAEFMPWLSDPNWRPWGTWDDVRKMPRRWRDLFVQGLLLYMENPSEVPEDLLPSISEVSLANPKGKRSALHALATAQGLSLTRVARASSVGVARVADFFAGKTLPAAVAEKIEKGLESLGVVEKL